MSSQDRLYVLWHDRKGGFFFPIAQLERRRESPKYVFRYLASFQEAHEHGLEALLAFPDVAKVYRSDLLFPFFENRLMRKSRPDYTEYVEGLGLDPVTSDEMAILGRSGGERATDSFLLVPELRASEPDRYELYFWASDVVRMQPTSGQSFANLETGSSLTVADQDLLLFGDVAVGKLPEYVRVFIPKPEPLKGHAEETPKIEVVRRNAQSRRYRLLCRLSLKRWDGLPQFAAMGGIPEDSERVGSRQQRSRPVVGKRLPEHLDNLVVHLSDGNIPQLPAFSRPLGGTLFDESLNDPEMRLEWSEARELLRLSGSSRKQQLSFRQVHETRSSHTHLDLEDGSNLYSEVLGSFGMDGGWWCELREWHWVGPESGGGPVRYWVGLLPDSSIDYTWMNLGVTTLNSEGLRGLHVEGSPSMTLLQVDEYDGGTRPRLAVIVQASQLQQDVERNLYRASNVLTAVTGVEEPAVFFGYDDSLRIRAARSRWRLKARRTTSWLPVLPLSGEQNRRDLRWPVPFLRCLRDNVFAHPTINDLHDALIWFRFVLEEPYWEGQLAKMGIVLRMLLRRTMGHSAADWLDSESVNKALVRFAETRNLNLAPDAKAVLALSHRMALLGDVGIPPFSEDARSFTQGGQLNAVQETLRQTFATLLAGVARYYGPVAGQLHPIRGWSKAYQPRRSLSAEEEQEQTRQEAEARAGFVAGDPDGFPW